MNFCGNILSRVCTKFHIFWLALQNALLYEDTAAAVHQDYCPSRLESSKRSRALEEDSKVIDFAALFSRILEHVYDSTASIRASVNRGASKTFLSMYVWLMPCSSCHLTILHFCGSMRIDRRGVACMVFLLKFVWIIVVY